MKQATIYKITNPNGKVYIGKTMCLSSRTSCYRNCNCKKQPLIYNIIKKYGWENHTLEVLETCNPDLLSTKEIEYITLLNTFYKNNPLGMNMTAGGDGTFGRVDTEETKLKRSSHHLGQKRSEETKQLMSLAKKGRAPKKSNYACSEEAKKKISIANKNKIKPDSYKLACLNTREKNLLENHGGILQINPVDNSVIKEWATTIKNIASTLNYDDSHIGKCIRGTKKLAYGFVWKYKY